MEKESFTHRVIAGKFLDNDVLAWETACGMMIEDGSEDEDQIVPPHLSDYNVEVSCGECQSWIGLMALRALD